MFAVPGYWLICCSDTTCIREDRVYRFAEPIMQNGGWEHPADLSSVSLQV